MMGSSLDSKDLWITLVCILTILLTSVGSSITWYEPPPIQTLSDTEDHLANSTQLLQGTINASLSWNFSLSSGLNFDSLSLNFNGTTIAGVLPSGPGVVPGFGNQFNIRWIPSQIFTLIIFNATTEVNGPFSCIVSSRKGFDAPQQFTSKIQVNVVDPPSNIVASSNLTVTAPANLTLNCSADGRPKPTPIWTRLSDNKVVSMPLNIIGEQDAGGYRCTTANGVGRALTKDVSIIVLVPPEVDYLTSDWDECENATLILSCNATGKPTPNITWRRVASDGTVIEKLPAVNGVYVLNNTNRNSSGQYRCTASNRVGIANKTVNVTVRFAASIDEIINSSNTVNEGGFFNMTCQASDNPLPTNYTWINKDGLLFNERVLSFINISRAEAGQYRCEVENRCGTDGRNTYVNVYYPPNITSISLNQTVVDEGDVVLLNCTADGNPKPNITWNRLSSNGADVRVGPAETYLDITGKQDEGDYRCIADNGIGNEDFSDVLNITVESYRPIKTVFSTNLTNNTVNLNESFNLICNADANPAATYRLYTEQESLQEQSNGTYLTLVSTRTKQVPYTCIPFNDFGDGHSMTINVTVYYAAEATGGGGYYWVSEGRSKLFSCPVDGNPEPNITWYKDNYVIGLESFTAISFFGRKISIAKELKANETGCYTCSANNSLGPPVTITHCLAVGGNCETNCTGGKECLALGTKYFCRCPNGTTGENCGQKDTFTDEAEMGFEFIKERFKPDYEKPEAPKTKEFILKVKQAIKTDMNDTGLIKELDVNLTPTVHQGERIVIANVKLKFSGSVGKGAIKELIDEALKDKKLGDLDVGRYKSDGFFSEEPTSDMPTSTGQPVKEGPPWTIIGAVAGSVVLVAFVVALVTWWVHKKRKCIKDTKIHNSECEESLHGDSPHAKVNRAYAESGPPSASGTEGAARQQSQDLGAIPTYAVVDKSKKKKKKEEKPPIYASVDKSKKRKKKTDDKNLYDNVEEPKKERKPGEVLYAELSDFQNPAMPEVSTSPAILPPLKRPPSYEQTQYADITAFLKGDATLPQNEGNEGSEMQQQSANQSQHDVDNKETPIQEDNGAYAKSGPPSANSTDVSSAAQKQPAQEAGAIPTYAVVDKSKKKKKEPDEMPLVNTDMGKSKKKKKKTDDKNLYDSVEEPKKEKKPGEIFYADLGEFQKQEMPKVATSPPTLPPLKRAPSYEKTDYAEITQFLKKEATLPREKTSNSEMKPQAANQTHDEVENKETPL